MIINKGLALIIGLLVICLFGVVVVFFPEYPVSFFLTATVTLVGTFLTIECVNNGVKGKFFNRELYDCENKNKAGIS